MWEQLTKGLIFKDMLHETLECYMDDLVVKSKKRLDHYMISIKSLSDCKSANWGWISSSVYLASCWENFWALLVDTEVSRLTKLKWEQFKTCHHLKTSKSSEVCKDVWPTSEDLYQILLVIAIPLAISWRREHLSNGMTHAKTSSIKSKGTYWVL